MTFFQTLKNALIHPSQLNQAKNMKGWKVFLYMLLLTVVLTIPIVITSATSFNETKASVSQFLDHTPDFSIQDGQLKTEKQAKGFIYDGLGMKLAFDPQNKQKPDQLLHDLSDDDPMGVSLMRDRLVFAVTKDNIASQMLPSNPLVISYKNSALESVTKAQFQKVLDNPAISSTFYVMMFIFSLIPTLINLAINLLFTGVIALLYCKMSRLSLRFSQVFKLIVFCTTLPALIAVIAQFIFPNFPIINYVYVFNLVIFFIAVQNERTAS